MGVCFVPIPVFFSSGMAGIVKLLWCAYSVLSKVPILPLLSLYLWLNRDYISSDRGGPGQNLRQLHNPIRRSA